MHDDDDQHLEHHRLARLHRLVLIDLFEPHRLGEAWGGFADALGSHGDALGGRGVALGGRGDASGALLGGSMEKPWKNLLERPPRIHVRCEGP